jgi:protein SCO1
MITIRQGRLMIALLFLCASFVIWLGGCNKSTTPAPAKQGGETSPSSPKRFPLKGKVVSIDKSAASITVNGEDIPGFMSAMVMPYKVKSPAEIAPLAPGDSITADVVSQDDDYWLENVKVAAHAAAPAAKPTSRLHFPSPASGSRIFNSSARTSGAPQLVSAADTVIGLSLTDAVRFWISARGSLANLPRSIASWSPIARYPQRTRLLGISFDPAHVQLRGREG